MPVLGVYHYTMPQDPESNPESKAIVDPPVIGIDLGTTFSAVGVWQDGEIHIIPNEFGNRITPSVVAYTATDRLVGDGAKNQMGQNSDNTVYSVKRFIGRKFSDETVQTDKKSLSFKVCCVLILPPFVAGLDDVDCLWTASPACLAVRCDEICPMARPVRALTPAACPLPLPPPHPITPRERDQSPMARVTWKGKQHDLTAEEISATVLQKMKTIAEDYLGQPVKNAVITVPAYFNDQQRQATQDAGAISGLNVVRILNEPTAAALAYGLHETEAANVLVFDLGGGTFDVSLLSISDGYFEVLATAGDTHLGGDDFDQSMVQHFVGVLKKKHNVDVAKNMNALARLRLACETAKRQLSASPSARVEVDGLVEGFDMSEKITRAKFEELNMEAFKGTLNPIKQVLEDSGLTADEVTEVVMVGGSTRIPKIQSLVKDFFGKLPHRGINPDEAIAYGAAVQGAVLSGAEELAGKVLLIDVIPLSLGIETVGGVMTKFVERNSVIPTTKSKVLSTTSDYQEYILFQVYEGERALTKDNRMLGTFELHGIKQGKRGDPQVEVTFDLDANGILKVSAKDKDTDAANDVSIEQNKDGLTQDEIERMIAEAEANADADDEARERVEAHTQLDFAIYGYKSKLNDTEGLGEVINEEDKDALQSLIDETSRWNSENPDAPKDEVTEKLEEFNKAATAITSQYDDAASEDDEDGEDDEGDSEDQDDDSDSQGDDGDENTASDEGDDL
eukprot:gene6886-1231_t